MRLHAVRAVVWLGCAWGPCGTLTADGDWRPTVSHDRTTNNNNKNVSRYIANSLASRASHISSRYTHPPSSSPNRTSPTPPSPPNPAGSPTPNGSPGSSDRPRSSAAIFSHNHLSEETKEVVANTSNFAERAAPKAPIGTGDGAGWWGSRPSSGRVVSSAPSAERPPRCETQTL